MTEAEWLTASEPAPMLAFLEGLSSERTARLFGLWCCRQCGCVLQDARLKAALVIADRLCEGSGGVAEADRWSAEEAAVAAWDDLQFDELDEYLLAPARLLGQRYTPADAERDGNRLAHAAEFKESNPDAFDGLAAELLAEQADALRDLHGNPFRLVTADPAWLTPTVLAVAAGIYTDRAFDRLPVLADALEDAGCDQAELLAHCRGPGPHARGCWAVDLVLGRG